MKSLFPANFGSGCARAQDCPVSNIFYNFFQLKKRYNIQSSIEELRKKYMDNPPKSITSADIRSMNGEALLNMDYFLNNDELDDDFGEDGFYIF